MKAIRIFILLMIGIATLTVAQNVDSIVVTYDNQHTIIPVPAFGKQTTIKMADSVQMIEFGVSRRKLSDLTKPEYVVSNAAASIKPIKKVKWYSLIEAGYTLKLFKGSSSEILTAASGTTTLYYNTDNIPGYRVGISIFENERCLSERFSYTSGFKIGFAQSFRKSKNIPEVNDTSSRIFVGFEPITITNLQFLFPIGFRQYFGSGKSYSMINFGSNIGSSIDLIKSRWSGSNIQYSGSPLILQPFLGFEIRKFGILTTMDLSFRSEYDVSGHGTKLSVNSGIGFALTYRLF